MKFELNKTIEILERTPSVIKELLSGLSEDWIVTNEGEETWSPYDVIGHLIHGETTDWIERLNIILSDAPEKTFRPFDRFAQFEESKGQSLQQLLEKFSGLRLRNLEYLKSLKLDETSLDKTGIHPKFGVVTLRQLLSTWAAHDLNHIAQIARVMAKQYKTEVGPWVEFLRVMQ